MARCLWLGTGVTVLAALVASVLGIRSWQHETLFVVFAFIMLVFPLVGVGHAARAAWRAEPARTGPFLKAVLGHPWKALPAGALLLAVAYPLQKSAEPASMTLSAVGSSWTFFGFVVFVVALFGSVATVSVIAPVVACVAGLIKRDLRLAFTGLVCGCPAIIATALVLSVDDPYGEGRAVLFKGLLRQYPVTNEAGYWTAWAAVGVLTVGVVLHLRSQRGRRDGRD
jgi:hypothetical protein